MASVTWWALWTLPWTWHAPWCTCMRRWVGLWCKGWGGEDQLECQGQGYCAIALLM
jgi:hypothetical protein